MSSREDAQGVTVLGCLVLVMMALILLGVAIDLGFAIFGQ